MSTVKREFFERIVSSVKSDVTVKGNKTPYTAINGNMFGFLTSDDTMCLRFSEERRTQLCEEFGTGPVLQYNSIMRGYVEIPDDVLNQENVVRDLFAESLAFAKSLKPKASKK